MRVFVKIWIVILLLSLIGTSYGKSKDSFKVKSITDYQKRNIVFIHVKYKCSLKTAENITLKIYALLKKSKKETATCGTLSFPEVKKGFAEEIFMINSTDTRRYGSPKKYHAEIWYKDKLAAEKSKPSKNKTKWWEEKNDKKPLNIIVRGDAEVERQFKRRKSD